MERTPIISFMNIREGLKLLIEEPYECVKNKIDEKTINKYLKNKKFAPDLKIRFIIIMRPNNPYYINKENKIFKYNKLYSRDKYPIGDIIIVFKTNEYY
jgi:hypothetical protein